MNQVIVRKHEEYCSSDVKPLCSLFSKKKKKKAFAENLLIQSRQEECERKKKERTY